MNLNVGLLRVLVMVMDERNVTRAAERLNQTQPSVSIALRRLRNHFDDPLFLPMRRGVVPTPRAIDLAHRAAKILREIEELIEDEKFEPATEKATILIGANDFGVLSVVAPLQRKLRAQAPGIKLHVRRLEPDLSRQLDRQEVDMSITMLSEPNRSAYVVPLFHEPLVVAVSVGHPLVQEQMTLDNFCAYDHVRVTWADTNLVDPIDNMLHELGRQRNTALQVQSYFYLPQVLKDTGLIAVAPRALVAQLKGELVSLPLPIQIPGFAMSLVWDDRTHTSARHMWVRSLISELFEGEGISAARGATEGPKSDVS